MKPNKSTTKSLRCRFERVIVESTRNPRKNTVNRRRNMSNPLRIHYATFTERCQAGFKNDANGFESIMKALRKRRESVTKALRKRYAARLVQPGHLADGVLQLVHDVAPVGHGQALHWWGGRGSSGSTIWSTGQRFNGSTGRRVGGSAGQRVNRSTSQRGPPLPRLK